MSTSDHRPGSIELPVRLPPVTVSQLYTALPLCAGDDGGDRYSRGRFVNLYLSENHGEDRIFVDYVDSFAPINDQHSSLLSVSSAMEIDVWDWLAGVVSSGRYVILFLDDKQIRGPSGSRLHEYLVHGMGSRDDVVKLVSYDAGGRLTRIELPRGAFESSFRSAITLAQESTVFTVVNLGVVLRGTGPTVVRSDGFVVPDSDLSAYFASRGPSRLLDSGPMSWWWWSRDVVDRVLDQPTVFGARVYQELVARLSDRGVRPKFADFQLVHGVSEHRRFLHRACSASIGGPLSKDLQELEAQLDAVRIEMLMYQRTGRHSPERRLLDALRMAATVDVDLARATSST